MVWKNYLAGLADWFNSVMRASITVGIGSKFFFFQDASGGVSSGRIKAGRTSNTVCAGQEK